MLERVSGQKILALMSDSNVGSVEMVAAVDRLHLGKVISAGNSTKSTLLPSLAFRLFGCSYYGLVSLTLVHFGCQAGIGGSAFNRFMWQDGETLDKDCGMDWWCSKSQIYITYLYKY